MPASRRCRALLDGPVTSAPCDADWTAALSEPSWRMTKHDRDLVADLAALLRDGQVMSIDEVTKALVRDAGTARARVSTVLTNATKRVWFQVHTFTQVERAHFRLATSEDVRDELHAIIDNLEL